MLGTTENPREQCSPGGNEKETDGKWRQSLERQQYSVIALNKISISAEAARNRLYVNTY
jgi:hypothetical protein